MATKVLDLLPRLLALEDEHRRTKPDRRLSIENAAFLMALEEPERRLLRVIAQSAKIPDRSRVRWIAKELQIEPAQIYVRSEELARKLRIRLEEIDQMAREYALKLT